MVPWRGGAGSLGLSQLLREDSHDLLDALAVVYPQVGVAAADWRVVRGDSGRMLLGVGSSASAAPSAGRSSDPYG